MSKQKQNPVPVPVPAYDDGVMIPCISNAVSGVLLLIKRTQKFLRKFMGSSEAMGWAARGRQDVYVQVVGRSQYIYNAV